MVKSSKKYTLTKKILHYEDRDTAGRLKNTRDVEPY